MRQSLARSGLLAALLGFSPAVARAGAPTPAPASPSAAPPSTAVPSAAVPAAGAPAAGAPAAGAPAAGGSVAATDAQRFCQNVAAAAADARFALQTRKLNELQEGIARRVAALEAKELEVKAVLTAHEEAKKHAEASLVAIYAKMRPDAAAQQIAALDDSMAAAVLSGLNARQSSAILNEVPADRAVKLVATMAGLVPPPEKPAPPRPAEDTRS